MTNTNIANDVTHMLAAMQAFSGVLNAETIALNSRDLGIVDQLFPQKCEFAQMYHEAMLRLDDQQPLLKTLEPALKQKFKAAYDQFQITTEQNRRALSAAKNVAERMVNIVMDAARKTVMDGPSYGRNGTNVLAGDVPIHYRLNQVL